MRRPLLFVILLSLSIPAPPAIAEPPSAEGEIRVALERWTSDFNAGQSDKICGLFASDLCPKEAAPARDIARTVWEVVPLGGSDHVMATPRHAGRSQMRLHSEKARAQVNAVAHHQNRYEQASAGEQRQLLQNVGLRIRSWNPSR
jgi:hypothetical protein